MEVAIIKMKQSKNSLLGRMLEVEKGRGRSRGDLEGDQKGVGQVEGGERDLGHVKKG